MRQALLGALAAAIALHCSSAIANQGATSAQPRASGPVLRVITQSGLKPPQDATQAPLERYYHAEPPPRTTQPAVEARTRVRISVPAGVEPARALSKIEQERRAKYGEIIDRWARARGLPPALVHAVVRTESAYRANAVSHAGAAGLMQLMPATAKRYGVSFKGRFDPEKNVKAGTEYLRDLLDMFNGDVKLALAGYNAGEGAVMRYGRKIPPFRETQRYVPKVLANMAREARVPGLWDHVHPANRLPGTVRVADNFDGRGGSVR